MNNIIGISFPVLPKHAKRLLSMKEAVFIKYMPHETAFSKLEKNMPFFIYESHANKEILGKARIVDFKFMDMKEVLDNYPDKLFLSENELIEYSKGRKKKVFVLMLDSISRYEKPIKIKPINMGGKYIIEDDLKGDFQ